MSRSYLNHLVYLLIKYIKSGVRRVAKLLFYTEDARCLKVKGLSVLSLDALRSENLKVSFKKPTLSSKLSEFNFLS